MTSPRLSNPTNIQPVLHSATPSDATSSPALSFSSKAYSPRPASSASSLASSPTLRDSFEIFGSSKRQLEDVREEPQERDGDIDMINIGVDYFLDNYASPKIRTSFDHISLESYSHSDYGTPGREIGSEGFATTPSFKKRRSGDQPLPGVTSRFGTRVSSLSKRWKNKSGAGPQLSIITHSDHGAQRTSSGNPSQLISPALSAISKHESHLPGSPLRTSLDDNISEHYLAPIDIEKVNSDQEENQGQATTPLLPPMLMELSKRHSPVQSPLQSPTVAEAPSFPASATPISTPPLQSLPSPPLSTKPSMASVRQRSRAGTLTAPPPEVPPLQMLDDQSDEWSQRLGHANFSIHPEPYLPEINDLDSYRELRANWDLARCNYAKHLARTSEHYGTTSKIYKLTEDKWAVTDAEWKRCNEVMTNALRPLTARLSDEDSDMTGSASSSAMLDKPITRVIVPQIDDTSGKFPKLGDEDIIGPMTKEPPKDKTMQANLGPVSQGRNSKKRNFFKFISDIIGRGSGMRS